MKYGKYSFQSIVSSDIVFNDYSGSALRGGLGFHLKRSVCPIKKGYCKECLLKTECLYIKIFAPSSLSCNNPPTMPNAFVIEPPLNRNNIIHKGADFNFNIIIFGDFNKYIPYFIYAMDNVGKNGIGTKLFKEGEEFAKRGTFALNSVFLEDTLIYLAENQRLNLMENLPDISVNLDKTENIKKIKIDFITPFRMKYKNRFNSDADFHILARGMIRRAKSLMAIYGNEALDIDYQDMIQRAEKIKIIETNITWEDLSRYSGRQKKRMFFGGIKGSVVYEGELGEFMPLIKFCEKTYIGKQSSFGLGRIKASVI
ncbi:MAG: CRISPR system precrRNA processing endoribonuclease RAMP protein Cas6 [Deltaproteobacteria bacterium]|nr:CRISPR system precrRNA processing endoribonuclease RAMP protein Cas6 [Deltaproteobacteria bacterium]